MGANRRGFNNKLKSVSCSQKYIKKKKKREKINVAHKCGIFAFSDQVKIPTGPRTRLMGAFNSPKLPAASGVSAFPEIGLQFNTFADSKSYGPSSIPKNPDEESGTNPPLISNERSANSMKSTIKPPPSPKRGRCVYRARWRRRRREEGGEKNLELVGEGGRRRQLPNLESKLATSD